MRDATLCIPIKQNQIMLGMKKRGFGVGKLNGFGGKIEQGETVEQAACRELFEEVGINAFPEKIKKVAEINFIFPSKTEWNQIVHVFLISNWVGEPKESEEMSFEFHNMNKIPFERMWQDDQYWLPLVLQGKTLKAEFHFADDNNSIKQKTIIEL